MESIVTTNAEELQRMFQLPSTLVITRGTQQGIVLKFKTFYLKLYDEAKVETTYLVKGFRYTEKKPVFEMTVESFNFREFAKQFDREDYLVAFQEPCDDPNCQLLAQRHMRTYS